MCVAVSGSVDIVHLHFIIKVNGEARDSRATSLDVAELLSAIAASASVKDRVELLAALPSGAVRRFELSQKLCFLNRLCKSDVTLLMTITKKTYADMGSCKCLTLSALANCGVIISCIWLTFVTS